MGSGSILLELLVQGRPQRFEASIDPSPDSAEPRTFGRTVELRRLDDERWQERVASLKQAVVALPGEWERFRNLVLREIVPSEAGQGVTVSFEEQKLYLIFNDQQKDRALCLTQAPPGWEFTRNYEVNELKDLCLRILPVWSGRPLEQCAPTVFQTRELGTGAFPFACILPANGDALTMVFERKEPVPEGRWERTKRETQSVMSLIWVLASSHTICLVNHPISAPTRFLLAFRDSVETKLVRLDSRLLRLPALEKIAVPLVSTERRRMDLAAFEGFLDESVSGKAAPAKLRFLIDGSQYFPRLKEAIEGARRSVHLRTYIFDNDDVALEIAELLKEKSKTAQVCVLCDGLGTLGASQLAPASAPLEPVRTPAAMLKHLTDTSRVQVRRRPNTWLAGDHSKCTTIDGEVAFLGGMNIGREYRYEWHDMMVEVTGPLVPRLEQDFAEAWEDSGPLGGFGALLARGSQVTSDDQESKGPTARLLFTRPGQPEIFAAQLEAIRRSQGYAYLQNAYFADDQMVYEVCAARKRGVDARAILPLRGDSGLMNRSNIVTINTLLHHGVRVFIYPRMTHIKAVVFDGWACFGSANLDQLSLKRNREVNLATTDPEVVQVLLERLFNKDMDGSFELTEELPESVADQLMEVVADEL